MQKSIEKPKFLTKYDHRPRPVVACTEEERMTKSEFAQDCDINLIMDKYRKTGQTGFEEKQARAVYGDCTKIPSFVEMQEKIIAAKELFASLPAKVRKQFDNDPAQFVDAANTEEGRKLLVALGLGKEEVMDDSPKGTPSLAPGVPEHMRGALSAAGQAAPAPSVAPGVAGGEAKSASPAKP